MCPWGLPCVEALLVSHLRSRGRQCEALGPSSVQRLEGPATALTQPSTLWSWRFGSCWSGIRLTLPGRAYFAKQLLTFMTMPLPYQCPAS